VRYPGAPMRWMLAQVCWMLAPVRCRMAPEHRATKLVRRTLPWQHWDQALQVPDAL